MPSKAGTNGHRRAIDLDKIRAARAEVEQQPIVVTYKEQDFELPPELPFDFADLLGRGHAREAFGVLLGDDTERFFALKPTLPDIKDLSEELQRAYGMTEGESSASPKS